MARRDDILTAVYEAERLHRAFDIRARVNAGEGRVDVFGMLVGREVPVMFRPLKSLLGAYIDHPDRGIILNSQRPLPVQRFTAAHELGHAALGHETSLDDENAITRAFFVADASYDPREIQANAFASHLLTPSWLIAHHMRRQGWTRDRLLDPVIVYQLALRMGSSYVATCYALRENKGIDGQTCEKLLNVRPRSIKQTLIGGRFEPENWYADVWVVTERDHGTALEGSRSDLVVLQLYEHASAGYLWTFDQLRNAGLAVREDGRAPVSHDEQIGGVVSRTIVAQSEEARGASGRIHLTETRPWNATARPLRSLDVAVELSGPVPAGRLPAQRQALLGVG